MKSAVEQLSTYKSVHLNKKNVRTHLVGVPLIIWAVMVLLNLVVVPLPFESLQSIPLVVIAVILVITYYFLLNIRLAIGQVLFFLPLLYVSFIVAKMPEAIWIGVAVFVVGWVIQFIGHHYEKAKPAFVDDLNQLLIGPLFVMTEVYVAFGALKEFDKEITKLAIQKRRDFESLNNESTANAS